jgi:predicted GIY-YIG superfamily endonuclease
MSDHDTTGSDSPTTPGPGGQGVSYTNVYVLQLEDGYYYIGKSHDVEARYYAHIDGDGCAWTVLHKPVKVAEILEKANPFEEDRMVKQYMGLYGIDKVRGGTYIHENLSIDEINFLQREIWSAQERCMRCGRDNHLAKTCRAQTNIYDVALYDPYIVCDICNRQGHKSSQCYAKTRQDGSLL